MDGIIINNTFIVIFVRANQFLVLRCSNNLIILSAQFRHSLSAKSLARMSTNSSFHTKLLILTVLKNLSTFDYVSFPVWVIVKFVPLNVMISYGFVEMIAQLDKNIQVVNFNKKFFMDGFAGKLLSWFVWKWSLSISWKLLRLQQ